MRADHRATARRLAARSTGWAASRIADVSRGLSDAPAGESSPGAPGVDYADWWKPGTEQDARRQIVTYDDEERFERTGKEEMVRLAPFITAGSTVVDLGCGIGRVAYYTAPLCNTLWAADVSLEMLRYAKRRLAEFSNVRYALCDNTRVIDVPDRSADFVYSIIVLQHLEREDAFMLMRDALRMLRPGGTAFFTWPNLLHEFYAEAFVRYSENGEVANASRARMYTTTELQCILPRVGFSDVKVLDAPNIVTICTR